MICQFSGFCKIWWCTTQLTRDPPPSRHAMGIGDEKHFILIGDFWILLGKVPNTCIQQCLQLITKNKKHTILYLYLFAPICCFYWIYRGIPTFPCYFGVKRQLTPLLASVNLCWSLLGLCCVSQCPGLPQAKILQNILKGFKLITSHGWDKRQIISSKFVIFFTIQQVKFWNASKFEIAVIVEILDGNQNPFDGWLSNGQHVLKKYDSL